MFDAPAEPFDKDVVQCSATSIHADTDGLVLLECSFKGATCKLGILTGIEDFRCPILP